MINTSSILANAKVNIYSTDVATDSRGAITNVETLKYSNVRAKIESKEVDIPISYNGAAYRHLYLLMTWTQPDGSIYDIQDQDIIEDVESGKRYLALHAKPGSLMAQKPYKLETEMIVLADDRFVENQTPI